MPCAKKVPTNDPIWSCAALLPLKSLKIPQIFSQSLRNRLKFSQLPTHLCTHFCPALRPTSLQNPSPFLPTVSDPHCIRPIPYHLRSHFCPALCPTSLHDPRHFRPSPVRTPLHPSSHTRPPLERRGTAEIFAPARPTVTFFTAEFN